MYQENSFGLNLSVGFQIQILARVNENGHSTFFPTKNELIIGGVKVVIITSLLMSDSRCRNELLILERSMVLAPVWCVEVWLWNANGQASFGLNWEVVCVPCHSFDA